LGVTFKLSANTTNTIWKNLSDYLQKRSHLPKGNSCGCVFKNPESFPLHSALTTDANGKRLDSLLSAGALIERAGLKGYQLGDAKVSELHANFILQQGNSSYDVYALVQMVKKIVYEKFAVTLQEEVIYIGDFYDSYS
jgi:UDP-N-acetylenolpyruvoylglucosamine reductase